MPYCTSAIACSLVSAQCIGPTRRQFERSTVLPYARASSLSTSQCSARASKPAAVVAPTESRQMQPRIAQVPTLVLERHRLLRRQQPHDDVEALLEQFARLGLRDPDHDAV